MLQALWVVEETLTNNMISEGFLGIDPNGRESVFPLYIYYEEFGKTVRTPNLNPEIVNEISKKLGLPFAPDSNGGKTDRLMKKIDEIFEF